MSDYLRKLEQKQKEYVNRDLIAFYIGIGMKLEKYEDGSTEQKKKLYPPTNWSEFTLDYCKTLKSTYVYNNQLYSYQGIGIATGEKNNIFVFDVDDVDRFEELIDMKMDHVLAKLWTSSVPTVKTRKGYHFYFRYDSRYPERKLGLGKCFDILTNGSFVVAPPTEYNNYRIVKEDASISKATYRYDGDKADIHDPNTRFPVIPEFLDEFLRKYYDAPEREKNPKVEQLAQDDAETFTIPNLNSFSGFKQNVDIIALLDKLPEKYSKVYDEWFKILAILKNEGYSIEVAKHFSMKCPKKCNDNDLITKWNSIRTDHKNPAMLGTLIHTLQEEGLYPRSNQYVLPQFQLTPVTQQQQIQDISTQFMQQQMMQMQQMMAQQMVPRPVGRPKKVININEEVVFDQLNNERLLDDFMYDDNSHAVYQYTKSVGLWVKKTNKVEIGKSVSSLFIEKFGTGLSNDDLKAVKSTSFYNRAYLSLIGDREKNDRDRERLRLLDSNEFLFAFRNGVYDFEEMQFRSFRRDDYITQKVNYDLRPREEIPKEEFEFVDNFYRTIFPDDELRNDFIKVTGSSLPAYRKEKIIVFLIDDLERSGNNGKSTLTGAIMKVFDSKVYSKPGNKSLLYENKNQESVNGHGSGLLAYKGVRLTVFDETDKDKKLNTEFLKDVTGENEIIARPLQCSESVVFKWTALLMIACNHKNIPKSQADDEAWVRRPRIYPCLSKFTKDGLEEGCFKMDKELPGKLQKLRDVHFYKLLDGYVDYIENGIFNVPKLSQEWISVFTKKSDQLYNEMYEFVTETYKEVNEGYVNRKEAIADFKYHSGNVRNMKLNSETLKMMMDKVMMEVFSAKHYPQKYISTAKPTNQKNIYYGVGK